MFIWLGEPFWVSLVPSLPVIFSIRNCGKLLCICVIFITMEDELQELRELVAQLRACFKL